MYGHQTVVGSWSGRLSRRYNGMAGGWAQSIHWFGTNNFTGLAAPRQT